MAWRGGARVQATLTGDVARALTEKNGGRTTKLTLAAKRPVRLDGRLRRLA
jgi:hypothetical protein